MSIETWKDEFYKVNACEVEYTNNIELIDHCLNKWDGLQDHNLKKHDLVKGHYNIYDKDDNTFDTSAPSCALCQVYDINNCEGCPITKVRGYACSEDNEDDYDDKAPWYEWTHASDPQPMIYWLKKAKEELC
jgi:hypothetical protein